MYVYHIHAHHTPISICGHLDLQMWNLWRKLTVQSRAEDYLIYTLPQDFSYLNYNTQRSCFDHCLYLIGYFEFIYSANNKNWKPIGYQHLHITHDLSNDPYFDFLFHLFMRSCVSLCMWTCKCMPWHTFGVHRATWGWEDWFSTAVWILEAGLRLSDFAVRLFTHWISSIHFELLVCSRYTCYSIKQPGVTWLLLYWVNMYF